MPRAFRRRAAPSTPEARVEAAAIQQARRRGLTNRDIAQRLGINERTVRKIVAGETPGTRIYREKVTSQTSKDRPASPNIFRADLRIGQDAEGGDVVRTINVKLPDVPGARGRRAPNFFDVLRLPDLQGIANAEAMAMQQRYATAILPPDCERTYCGHSIEDHGDPNAKDAELRGCVECPCPRFRYETTVLSLRPIVKRNPAKILHTVRGSYA
jgi:hypothetical protein